MNQYCFLNGKILPLAEAKVGIEDIGLLRGYGIYDGIASFNGKPFRFSDHWNRFLSGVHILSLNVPITEEKAERVIEEILLKNGFSKRANVRMILTGGKTLNGIEYDFEHPTFYILAEKWEPLSQDFYEKGVRLITYEHMRELPKYKTVITPDENILKGITRKVVLELALNKYKIEERPVEEEELKTADEVFITSSFKDIVPIVRINDFEVANGQVGLVTKKLMEEFAKVVNIG